MTDRVKGFVVTLDKDYRDDDVEVIRRSIEMIKGVTVVGNVIDDPSSTITENRVRSEIREKLYNLYKEIL